MYHYIQFDPYLTRELNHQMRNEMSKLRLEKRLHEADAGASRLHASILLLKSALHPLRRTALAGR